MPQGLGRGRGATGTALLVEFAGSRPVAGVMQVLGTAANPATLAFGSLTLLLRKA
jgi:hypothetical protein